MANELYFGLSDFAAIAEYLGMPLDEFLRWRQDGRFPVLPKPKDPTQVYYRADLEKWRAAGKPCGRNWSMGL